jgi:hypothetical protein
VSTFQASHAALYKRFGDWIRSCYGGVALGQATATTVAVCATTTLQAGRQTFDRVVLQEDQRKGQQVRGWAVEWSGDSGATWNAFASGRSIGNKRIALSTGSMAHTATHVRLNVTAVPAGSSTAVNVTMRVLAPCPTGTLDTIKKIGTEDIGMTETTPLVINGSLYRFESVRARHRLRIREHVLCVCFGIVPAHGLWCLNMAIGSGVFEPKLH